jgi:hypothetical protein
LTLLANQSLQTFTSNEGEEDRWKAEDIARETLDTAEFWHWVRGVVGIVLAIVLLILAFKIYPDGSGGVAGLFVLLAVASISFAAYNIWRARRIANAKDNLPWQTLRLPHDNFIFREICCKSASSSGRRANCRRKASQKTGARYVIFDKKL